MSDPYAGRAPETQRWLESGEYLPPFMRDFHDQKDVFKAMQEVVERANAKHTGYRSIDVTWTAAHIYTVDVFLWVMARHGYTLQPARKRVPFSDVHRFIGDARQRLHAASAALLRGAFASSKSEKGTAQ